MSIVGERREGAEVELPFWPAHLDAYSDRIEEPVTHGRILTWRPPELFEWTWDTDFLRYHVCLDQLEELLDGGPRQPLVEVDVAPWERRYAAAFA